MSPIQVAPSTLAELEANLLLYCEPEAQSRVRARLTELGCQFAPFRFHGTGVRAMRGRESWAPSI